MCRYGMGTPGRPTSGMSDYSFPELYLNNRHADYQQVFTSYQQIHVFIIILAGYNYQRTSCRQIFFQQRRGKYFIPSFKKIAVFGPIS
jgi:hypothetical protein